MSRSRVEQLRGVHIPELSSPTGITTANIRNLVNPAVVPPPMVRALPNSGSGECDTCYAASQLFKLCYRDFFTAPDPLRLRSFDPSYAAISGSIPIAALYVYYCDTGASACRSEAQSRRRFIG